MEKSEHINELAKALASAQGEMKGASKDSSNPFYKSKYADLASVWNAIGASFQKHGLSVVQTTSEGDKGLMLHTTLLHSSGQYVTGGILVKPVKNDPQGLGSALTYYRRYALSAIAGVYAEDDDGNLASGKKPEDKPSIPQQSDPAKDYFLAPHPEDDFPAWDDLSAAKNSDSAQTNDRIFTIGKYVGKKFSEVSDGGYIGFVAKQVETNLNKTHQDLKDFYSFLKERGVLK
jgi:ERF superfamily